MDKYYTNSETAQLVHHVALARGCARYVEPSAGGGAISKRFDEITSYDILPEAPGIIKKNWFDVDMLPESCCVVGNPPFGDRSKLAIEFINHAFKIGADEVIFILPNTFKKHTIQSKITKRAFLSKTIDLPSSVFEYEGKPYHVPCCLQVWQRDMREGKEIPINDYFEFSMCEFSDFFVFGAAPSKCIDPSEVEPSNRGYYIKVKKPETRKMFEEMDWKGNSTVNGNVAWFTKREMSLHFVNK